MPLRYQRHTARGIVVHDNKLLLMERWRLYEQQKLHYFSIPGGGIEPGETPEQTVVREIEEETMIAVRVRHRVLEMHDGDSVHAIYLCEYISGEPALAPHAPEAIHGDDNRFKPGWVPVAKLSDIPLTYWEPLRSPLIEGLKNGFARQPVIVNAGVSG